MKIISVVGARPNFMKIAPFIQVIDNYNASNSKGLHTIQHRLVHTGQHYDEKMNNAFFRALNIPVPDINLGIGSGSHAEQVGRTMIEFEKVLQHDRPDWVVLVGDVNATLACSVTAKKLNIKCCHIEAGLRSGDMTMPEEINRLVTDRLCDLLLTPDEISSQNLIKEGVVNRKIEFVGNIMIDTLTANRKRAAQLNIDAVLAENLVEERPIADLKFNDIQNGFAIVTIHRPSNVDHYHVIEPLLNFIIDEVSEHYPIFWPVHPRTVKMLKRFDLWDKMLSANRITPLCPVGYLEMLRLNMQASLMITDSGGLQEECSVLGTPCMTLRWNTERPVTLEENGGVSILTGNSIDRIRKEYKRIRNWPRIPKVPPLWDGQTAKRCLNAILTASINKPLTEALPVEEII